MKTTLSLSAWVLLLLAEFLTPSQAHAAVKVYGIASSSGPVVTVQVYADITATPIMSYCFKLSYDARSLRVLTADRNEAVWNFFDGARQIPYMSADTSRTGELLFVGARLDARDPLAGVVGDRVLLGTAAFGRTAPSTPAFNVTLGRAGLYANFVTTAGVKVEAQSTEMRFEAVSPDPSDRDLDGLRDQWEIQFFGSTERASYTDDPDQDGVDNLGEQLLGSDPTDPRSNLRLDILRQPTGVLLQWTSAADRTYTVEASDDLRTFRPLQSGIPATPPVNSFAIEERAPGSAAFYRIRLESPASP